MRNIAVELSQEQAAALLKFLRLYAGAKDD
jgi:hypothetical protein